jgi:hypothetical protein
MGTIADLFAKGPLSLKDSDGRHDKSYIGETLIGKGKRWKSMMMTSIKDIVKSMI